MRLRIPFIRPTAARTEEELLDIADAILQFRPKRSGIWIDWMNRASRLASILTISGSCWCVNAEGTGLERRVDSTVAQAVAQTVRSTGVEAADHLSIAWVAAYGRNPDPDKAYDEAVLAVEALACPLVCPKNPRRSLGSVIADLRNQASQWKLAIGDTTGKPAGVDRLIEMLALLWQGQSRHAGSPNSRHQTQIEAEAAVHLAAAIVQWLTGGVLYKP